MNLDGEVWAIANRVCTPAELRALRKREDLARRGEFTWASLARTLEVSTPTARARVARAEEKIREAQSQDQSRCEEVSPLNGKRCELPAGHAGWCVVGGLL